MRILAIALVLLLGLGLIGTPFVNKALERIRMHQTAEAVRQTIQTQREEARVQPDNARTEAPGGAPASAKPDAASIDYEPIQLDGAANAIGMLYIRDIGIRLAIMDGAGKSELRGTAGRLKNTADFGEIGNTVIAAHNQFDQQSEFSRLRDVKRGAQVDIVDMAGKHYIYRVVSTALIETDDMIYCDYLGDTRRTLTLWTCHPLFVSTYRLIKICDLVAVLDSEQNVLAEYSTHERETPKLPNRSLEEFMTR